MTQNNMRGNLMHNLRPEIPDSWMDEWTFEDRKKTFSYSISKILDIPQSDSMETINVFYPMLISGDIDVIKSASNCLSYYLSSFKFRKHWGELYTCFKFHFLGEWINEKDYEIAIEIAAKLLDSQISNRNRPCCEQNPFE